MVSTPVPWCQIHCGSVDLGSKFNNCPTVIFFHQFFRFFHSKHDEIRVKSMVKLQNVWIWLHFSVNCARLLFVPQLSPTWGTWGTYIKCPPKWGTYILSNEKRVFQSRDIFQPITELERSTVLAPFFNLWILGKSSLQVETRICGSEILYFTILRTLIRILS